jgi:hypothetical protein
MTRQSLTAGTISFVTSPAVTFLRIEMSYSSHNVPS